MATAAELLFREPDGLAPAARKLRGAVYTPAGLAEWLAELLAEQSLGNHPSVADFGCGDGALLEAAAATLRTSRLAGVEVDALAMARARRRLPKSACLIGADVLQPPRTSRSDLASYWRRQFDGAPRAVIMNPPWGAVHSLNKATACAAGLSLARGQFDTYDLFCELALRVVAPGGAYAFIVPDSIFLPEHAPLREMLLRDTTIRLVARLGEGIFADVFCGCAVVAGEVAPAPPGHLIECLRLTKQDRQGLRTAADYQERRRRLGHEVPQSRFLADPDFRFDIDVTARDATVGKLLSVGSSWTEPLLSGRGAEISKSGRVLVCSRCSSARPLPKAPDPRCLVCGRALAASPVRKIIADAPSPDGSWSPFIAGEDVRRFAVSAKRWIQTDLSGIAYKAPPQAGKPRLLVRKTGIGLNAAIDVTGAYTNQVVFEYALRASAAYSFSYLHYVLGVLSSRILFAFHLKRGGELEWRSHPYVTQKTLAALPIPLPRPGSQGERQAAAIAAVVAEHLATGDKEIEIEALVGGLYGLDGGDIEWVLDVLDGAADLDAMRRLRLASRTAIQPLTVG